MSRICPLPSRWKIVIRRAAFSIRMRSTGLVICGAGFGAEIAAYDPMLSNEDIRAAGAAPLYRGQPGYGSHMDRDGDGVACEPYRGR